jgi:hypothetical protein
LEVWSLNGTQFCPSEVLCIVTIRGIEDGRRQGEVRFLVIDEGLSCSILRIPCTGIELGT